MTTVQRAVALTLGSALLFGVGGLGTLALASTEGRVTKRAVRTPDPMTALAERDCRFETSVVMIPQPPLLLAVAPTDSGDGAGGGVAGSCPQEISTHTSSNFGPGTYFVQAGIGEQEIAAASYVVAADKFPLKIDLTEIIFATVNASVTTTTQWSVLIWEGTPASGGPKYVFSSDGDLIPHIVLPPGTTGVNVQFAVQSEDPADDLVINDNGSHTFSVGYRIDKHNQQTADPCFVAPPSCCNAFPCVDFGGLQAASQNWIFLLNCGRFGCGTGWKSFLQLPVFCKPSGDWVIRAKWTSYTCVPPEPKGACCVPGNTCIFVTQAECATASGTYQGDDVFCGIGSCQPQNVACCFAATGGCLNLSAANCSAAGGVPGAAGTNCTGFICFPTGACCLPNGSCIGPVSPETCAAQGGTFKGNNTTCAATVCPQPTGSCCFTTGFCLVLNQADCAAAGATWGGPGTNCADTNGNGTPDACESNPADLNHDGNVNSADLGILLGSWGQAGGPADLSGDGVVGSADISILLGAWG